MLNLTCTTKTSVDLAHYGVSRAKDWVSVDCGTSVLPWSENFHAIFVESPDKFLLPFIRLELSNFSS